MARRRNIFSKFFHHTVLLSVALTETGSVRGVRVRTFWVFLLVATVAAGVGVQEYTRNTPNIAALEKEAKQKAIYEAMIKKLEQEKNYQDQQFKLFAQELGVLQTRLERFDVISEKLFNDRELGKHLEGIDDRLDGHGGPETLPLDQLELPALDDLESNLEALHTHADKIEASMQAGLELLAKSYTSSLQQPYIWPVVYHRTHVTSPFGGRKDPFGKYRGWHSGVDLAGGYNAPVVASADGVVIFAGYRYGYGILVEVRHAQGYTTRYGHLNEALVRNGMQVKAGEAVGLMGSTGRSTGPHLHFEVLIDDKKVDPMPFIRGGREEALALAKKRDMKQEIAGARARIGRTYTKEDSVRDGYRDSDEIL